MVYSILIYQILQARQQMQPMAAFGQPPASPSKKCVSDLDSDFVLVHQPLFAALLRHSRSHSESILLLRAGLVEMEAANER